MSVSLPLDQWFFKVFSDKNQKTIESLILRLSVFGFVLHLLLIYAKRLQLFHSPFEAQLLKDPISAIYTPFSIILIYEVYLLVYYLPRSFTTSVSKQFEIISLIIIRKIFADIPRLQFNEFDAFSAENLQLLYDLLGILLLFFLIFLFNQKRDRLPKRKLSDKLQRFVRAKKGVSLVLLPIFVVVLLYSLSQWLWFVFNDPENLSQININYIFYTDFFTLMILADVWILLISFRYTERYSQLIRNTGFIISAILIRLSFNTTGLFNLALIVFSVIFSLLILRIYLAIENSDDTSATAS
ncbi:MAG: hypothetical protein ACON42_01975 [Flavobacteriaceae bacterium]